MFHIPAHKNTQHPAGQVAVTMIRYADAFTARREWYLSCAKPEWQFWANAANRAFCFRTDWCRNDPSNLSDLLSVIDAPEHLMTANGFIDLR